MKVDILTLSRGSARDEGRHPYSLIRDHQPERNVL